MTVRVRVLNELSLTGTYGLRITEKQSNRLKLALIVYVYFR